MALPGKTLCGPRRGRVRFLRSPLGGLYTAPFPCGRRLQVSSSNGRASASKADGYRFKSCLACSGPLGFDARGFPSGRRFDSGRFHVKATMEVRMFYLFSGGVGAAVGFATGSIIAGVITAVAMVFGAALVGGLIALLALRSLD